MWFEWRETMCLKIKCSKKESRFYTNTLNNKMRNEMASCNKSVAKEVLGESKGCGQLTKKTWWCNKEVQATVNLKRESG